MDFEGMRSRSGQSAYALSPRYRAARVSCGFVSAGAASGHTTTSSITVPKASTSRT